MPVLKYRDPDSGQWEDVSATGPTGPAGPAGPAGFGGSGYAPKCYVYLPDYKPQTEVDAWIAADVAAHGKYWAVFWENFRFNALGAPIFVDTAVSGAANMGWSADNKTRVLNAAENILCTVAGRFDAGGGVMIADAAKRTAAVTAIKDHVQTNGLKGVNINFEPAVQIVGTVLTDFTAFVTELRTALNAIGPEILMAHPTQLAWDTDNNAQKEYGSLNYTGEPTMNGTSYNAVTVNDFATMGFDIVEMMGYDQFYDLGVQWGMTSYDQIADSIDYLLARLPASKVSMVIGNYGIQAPGGDVYTATVNNMTRAQVAAADATFYSTATRLSARGWLLKTITGGNQILAPDQRTMDEYFAICTNKKLEYIGLWLAGDYPFPSARGAAPSSGGGSVAVVEQGPRLERVATFYSWWSYVNGLNPATPEEAAPWYGNYENMIAPDGSCDPRHGDNGPMKEIFGILKAKYPRTKVWGYVSTTRDQTNMTYPDTTAQEKIDQWQAMGAHGIFLDEYGFDYGVPIANDRARQNELLDYIHGKGMFAVMNAWESDDAMSPSHGPVHCGIGDVFYAESFTYHPDDHPSDGGWAPLETLGSPEWTTGMVEKATKMQQYRKDIGVKFWLSNMLQRTGAGAKPYAEQMAIMRQCEAAARIFRADAMSVDSYEYSNGVDASVLDPFPFVLDNGDPLVPDGVWRYTTNLSIAADDLGLTMHHSRSPQVVRHDVVEADRQPQVLRRDGGTMTGPMILHADPAVPLGAATKQYVDTRAGGGGGSAGLGRSILDYGADPTGVALCDAAFAQALAENGTALVPLGEFKISQPIVVTSGKALVGEVGYYDWERGWIPNSMSQIIQTNVNAPIITGTELVGVRLENLALDAPPGHTTDGVAFTKGTHGATNYVTLNNVVVTGVGRDAYSVENLIVSTWSGVLASAPGRHGFNLYGQYGGAAGTSFVLNTCYVVGSGDSGYKITTMTYASMISCAADSCVGVSYDIVQCAGMNLHGCGSEGAKTDSFKFSDWSTGCTATGCWGYGQEAGDVFSVSGSRGIVFTACSEQAAADGVTSFRTDADSTVTLINPFVEKPMAIGAATKPIG